MVHYAPRVTNLNPNPNPDIVDCQPRTQGISEPFTFIYNESLSQGLFQIY